jgi:hypothetical protein
VPGIAADCANEVAAPRGQLTVGVEPAGEPVEAAGPVEVVTHVVFARPLQLDRHADDLRDPGRLDRVVVREAPAEAAAGAQEVRRDLVRRDPQRL